MALLQCLIWVTQTPESNGGMAKGPHAWISFIECNVGTVLPRVVESHSSLTVFLGYPPLFRPEQEEPHLLMSAHEQSGVLQTLSQAQTLVHEFACRLILRP